MRTEKRVLIKEDKKTRERKKKRRGDGRDKGKG